MANERGKTLNATKAPFPWFGGKSRAADVVWSLLGDVPHYVEPFAGSLAVLLNRPHEANRSYFSETVNDLDGFVCNAWRAIQWYPEEVARAASWPVCETDKQARQIACLRWCRGKTLDLLAGDATWCDPVIAGWWLCGSRKSRRFFRRTTASGQRGMTGKRRSGARRGIFRTSATAVGASTTPAPASLGWRRKG